MKYKIYCENKLVAQFVDVDMRDTCFNLLEEYYSTYQFKKGNQYVKSSM